MYDAPSSQWMILFISRVEHFSFPVIRAAFVMKLLSQLNEEGTTIIMVTHSPYDANYAHRIVNLFDGKVVTENIKEQFHV